ncbi:uncharacterized protein BCR38DRAFT_492574 [Pseudomassariella vexata]|uniref:Rhodopsin domain-containing protein n=1 Tax=Pseudomassariella vexata TaxID=1141098 RepID=A0A1Y2EIL1_9PEZI|nr:uncharacterized protein BCR38DRAFT_492574 [Pseudomassariella vexata]ORY71421.1 hypothetical protein BCR38DRAFT_492574 [Pseudomassariella vexata]
MADAAQKFIQEVWGLQGTAYLVVGIRYATRIQTVGWQKLAWDDFFMLLATLVYTAESVAAYFVVAYWQGLANNAMTDDQRATLEADSPEWVLRVNGSKTHVIGLLLYTTLLWLLKACWVVYYKRLTEGVHNMRRLILGAMIVMPVTYVACLLVAFLKCIPFHHQWQINPSPGNNCMPAVSFIQTIFVMGMNTVTDFYLMAIPIPMVWKSNLPLRKKFTLLIMFSGGFLEMAFGILRCVSILTLGDVDPAQSGYWSVRESFVSFVLTNMPMVYPLVKKYIDKTRSSSRSKGTGTDSRGYRLNSYPRRGTAPRKHPLSIPAETTWESDSKEHIVADKVHISSGETSSLEQQTTKSHHRDIMSGNNEKSMPRSSKEQNRSKSRRRTIENQIIVTTEYTIQDTGPSPPQHARGFEF